MTERTISESVTRCEVSVGQTLHGYSEGHSLLASSNKLPKASQRIMLLMSDMSGPSMTSGFEEYLTGYPLNEISMYAFAKTWYAPEMSRPGCVWTHTLLVQFSDLAKITDLRILLSHFKRPEGRRSFRSYESMRSVDSCLKRRLEPKISNGSKKYGELVLTALYDEPISPVFLSSESTDVFEDLVLSIWNQQWPELRSSFLFSTGSLSNRKINGKRFDIQVVPKVILNQLKREVSDGKFLEIEKTIDPTAIPFWTEAAFRDLAAKDQEPLRDFLWRFGADVSNGREGFSRFVKTFLFVNEVSGDDFITLSRFIQRVARLFPNPKEAVRLKKAIIGLSEDDCKEVLPEFPRSELLRELATTDVNIAIDEKDLEIEKLGKELWISEQKTAERLVEDFATSTLNPLGEKVLAGIAQAVEVEDLIRLSTARPGLLYIFVNRNPGLAGSSALWSSFRNEKRELFEAVSAASESISVDIQKDILTAMLKSGVEGMSEDIVRLFGEHMIGAVLEWFNNLDNPSRNDLPTAWLQTLERRPQALLNWLDSLSDPRDASIALVACLLNPHSSVVREFGAKTWLRFLKRKFSDLDKVSAIQTMAYLLALGFENPGPRSYELVAQAFGTVYSAAEEDKLPERAWLLLKDQVPSLSWWRNWDKCERIRQALAEKFAYHKWPARYFFRIASREDVFSEIVGFSSRQSWGREFVSELYEESLKNENDATYQQRKVLSYYR